MGRRKALFEAQDEIDNKRDELISGIAGKLVLKTTLSEVFSIRWRLE